MILLSLNVFLATLLFSASDVLRHIFILKSRKISGFIISFLSTLLWITAARQLLVNNTLNLYTSFAFCLGFSTGTILGIWINGKVSSSFCAVEAIIQKDENNVIDILRKEGYTVSAMEVLGKEDSHFMIFIQVKISKANSLINRILTLSPNAFINTRDTGNILNGKFKEA